MPSRKTFWILTPAVAVLGLASGAVIADRVIHEPHVKTQAAWVEIYRSPSQMSRRVDVVVVAKAVGVEPGRVAYSDNGEDALPYQVFEFEPVNSVKGLRGDRNLFVERAGGDSPDGSNVYLDADGGPFEIGQTYLLFLKRQPDGPYFYQVNNQGRYRVANDRLQAVEKGDAVTDTLDGRTLREGLGMVRAALRRASPANE
jgi:hypothetical protein